MPKKKTSTETVETVVDAPGSLGAQPESEPVQETPEAVHHEVNLVSIHAPLGNEDGRKPMGVHVRLKQGRHKVLMRRLLNGLNEKSIRLRDGRHIEKFAHVVEYLLDEIDDA